MQAWANLVIPDDPVILSNIRGTISYAAVENDAGMAVNRTTQVYINFADNSGLDGQGFTPFGVISEADMKVKTTFYCILYPLLGTSSHNIAGCGLHLCWIRSKPRSGQYIRAGRCVFAKKLP
jgi:hypothetical protein